MKKLTMKKLATHPTLIHNEMYKILINDRFVMILHNNELINNGANYFYLWAILVRELNISVIDYYRNI